MVRRVTPDQLRSMIRQAEANRRRAISEYNRAVNEYNRKAKRAVDDYNRKVRAHNAQVRANRQRLRAEIARLESRRSSTRYTVSSQSLATAYYRVEEDANSGVWGERGEALVDLAGTEAFNSARVANALLGAVGEEEGEGTALTDELSSLSADLDSRWRGALYAISPRNPDAARHFCTSAREVILAMIDLKASDKVVLAAKPDCQTRNGQPLRREKIGYLLERYGASHDSLGDFVEQDINDVMDLFGEFNSATHGVAGKFDIPTLRSIKQRVEGSIRFLSAIVRVA